MNIFEKQKTPNAEQQKVNPEILWKKLVAMPETPGVLRKTLSSDNVKEYMRIMTSPQAVESGWLMLCGDLTKEQAIQYSLATGNLYDCLQEITDLAIKIRQDFKPHLLELVEKDIQGNKKEGLSNLFQSLMYLAEIKFEPAKNIHIGRDQLADQFILQSMALIGSDLIDTARNYGVDEKIRSKIKEIIEFYERFFRENSGYNFPGLAFYNEKTAYERTFEKKENLENIDRTIGFQDEYNFEDRLRISKENERLFADINNEAIYKKIPHITLNNEKPQIIAIRDEPDSGHVYSYICAVRVNFGEKKIDFPPLIKNELGNLACDYQLQTGIINFQISPKTGDLCFITCDIPLSQIMSGDRYLALKNYVLLKIKDYLKSKEPDIEDLFAYSPAELEARREEIKVREESGQPEEVPGELKQEPAQKSIEAEKLPEGKLSLPKNVRVMIMDKISGAKAEEILAALRRMLGKEEKTKGSHLFFRSDRNGKILPVPRHSQKDQHHISLPLILDNLKSWQYDPVELAMELGLKVPKKLLTNEA